VDGVHGDIIRLLLEMGADPKKIVEAYNGSEDLFLEHVLFSDQKGLLGCSTGFVFQRVKLLDLLVKLDEIFKDATRKSLWEEMVSLPDRKVAESWFDLVKKELDRYGVEFERLDMFKEFTDLQQKATMKDIVPLLECGFFQVHLAPNGGSLFRSVEFISSNRKENHVLMQGVLAFSRAKVEVETDAEFCLLLRPSDSKVTVKKISGAAYLNGRLMLEHEEVIYDGDVIRVGDQTFVMKSSRECDKRFADVQMYDPWLFHSCLKIGYELYREKDVPKKKLLQDEILRTISVTESCRNMMIAVNQLLCSKIEVPLWQLFERVWAIYLNLEQSEPPVASRGNDNNQPVEHARIISSKILLRESAIFFVMALVSDRSSAEIVNGIAKKFDTAPIVTLMPEPEQLIFIFPGKNGIRLTEFEEVSLGRDLKDGEARGKHLSIPLPDMTVSREVVTMKKEKGNGRWLIQGPNVRVNGRAVSEKNIDGQFEKFPLHSGMVIHIGRVEIRFLDDREPTLKAWVEEDDVKLFPCLLDLGEICSDLIKKPASDEKKKIMAKRLDAVMEESRSLKSALLRVISAFPMNDKNWNKSWVEVKADIGCSKEFAREIFIKEDDISSFPSEIQVYDDVGHGDLVMLLPLDEAPLQRGVVVTIAENDFREEWKSCIRIRKAGSDVVILVEGDEIPYRICDFCGKDGNILSGSLSEDQKCIKCQNLMDCVDYGTGEKSCKVHGPFKKELCKICREVGSVSKTVMHKTGDGDFFCDHHKPRVRKLFKFVIPPEFVNAWKSILGCPEKRDPRLICQDCVDKANVVCKNMGEIANERFCRSFSLLPSAEMLVTKGESYLFFVKVSLCEKDWKNDLCVLGWKRRQILIPSPEDIVDNSMIALFSMWRNNLAHKGRVLLLPEDEKARIKGLMVAVSRCFLVIARNERQKFAEIFRAYGIQHLWK
jgi:hypothetical protein